MLLTGYLIPYPAFFENDPPQSLITASSFRAPESILGYSISSGVDIWSFGCLLFELLTGSQLFQMLPKNWGDYNIDDHHLLMLTEIIGPLPEHLLAKWQRASIYYGPNRERLSTQPWDHDEDDIQGDSTDSKLDDEGDYNEFDDLEENEIPTADRSPPEPHKPLEKLFKDNKPDDIDEEEEQLVLSLLRSILQYEPHKRPLAADLLEHPWIKA